MAEALHLIVTNEGDLGWSLWSPQVPGLSYGRQTDEEIFAELDDVLAFAEAPTLPRIVHPQRRLTTADGAEYVLRATLDDRRGDRFEAAWLLETMMDTEQRHALLQGPRRITGELVFVCGVETDRIGSVVEQMAPEGDVVNVILKVGDRGLWVTSLAHGSRQLDVPASSLAALGLDLDSTLLQLMNVAQKEQRQLLAV